jgi:D-alanyl-D-alanine carboxypeptidase
LRNVTALAGVVHDPQGRPWALAAMVNDDERADQGRAVLDALVDGVARGALQLQPPR